MKNAYGNFGTTLKEQYLSVGVKGDVLIPKERKLY